MLPAGWTKGLTLAQIARIRATEEEYSCGAYRYLPSTHPKGYVRLWLPPGHPFAVRGGAFVAPDGSLFWTLKKASRAGWSAWELKRRLGWGGWCYLHRYLVQSSLGRVLGFEDHVHHRRLPSGEFAAKDTTVLEHLEVQQAAEHGRFHYGIWQGCGRHVGECEECHGGGCQVCIETGVVAR